MPGTCKVIGSIPSTARKEKEKRKKIPCGEQLDLTEETSLRMEEM